MTLAEKARLYRELSKMMDAGFHMDRSVDLLLSQRPKGGVRSYIKGLQAGFTDRLSFTDAVREKNAGLVTDLELSLIQAGEASGRLGDSLQHLSGYFDSMDRSLKAARSAMVYPLILLHLGVLIPAFAKAMLLNAMSQVSGTPSKSMGMGWEVALHLGTFWAALFALWMLWKMASSVARNSATVDRILGMIPLIGAVRRHWAMSRFAQVFHSALLAAMRMTDCISLAGASSQSGIVRSAADRTAASVASGEALASSMQGAGSFSPYFINSVATAEAAGGLDREMERWAKAEAENALDAQKRASEWYPKGLHIFIMAYVGWRIISLFMSYLDGLKNITA
jgi:type II secretory pathway component PulF